MSAAAPRAGSRRASSVTARSRPARTDAGPPPPPDGSRPAAVTAPAEDGQLSAASRIALPTATADGRSPPLGTAALLFVAAKGGHDSIWKLADGAATEIWTASGAPRLAGAPAISPDGRRVAFAVERGTRATLHVMSLDTMDARPLGEDLDVRGSPAWSPDGASIAVAALDRDVPRLFAVPPDGGPPRRSSTTCLERPGRPWSLPVSSARRSVRRFPCTR